MKCIWGLYTASKLSQILNCPKIERHLKNTYKNGIVGTCTVTDEGRIL